MGSTRFDRNTSMNTKLNMVLMLVALAGLVLASGFAFTGCATTPKQIHVSMPVNDLTVVIQGPARGHFAEETERDLFVWTETGSTCLGGAISGRIERVSHGRFDLLDGQSLCASPVRPSPVSCFAPAS